MQVIELLTIVASLCIFLIFFFLSLLFEFSLECMTDRDLQLFARPLPLADCAKDTLIHPALLWILNLFFE